jgi:hypothetical protein
LQNTAGKASPSLRGSVVVSVWDHFPHPDAAPPPAGGAQRKGGAQRAGLAGPGRGYALIVASLVGLASVPTLVVVTAGSVSVSRGAGTPEPFVIGVLPPSVLVIPVPPRPVAPQAGRSVPGRALVVELASAAPSRARTPSAGKRSRPRTKAKSTRAVPARVEPGTAVLSPPNRGPHRPRRPGCAEPRPRKPSAIHPRGAIYLRGATYPRGAGYVPGRSIGGWSRAAGPRR